MSVRRSLLVLTFLTFGLPLAVFGWQANRLQSVQGSSRNLQYYTVQLGDLNLAVTAIGTVEARMVANLSFTRPGQVVEVLVQPGDVVSEGEVLARLASEREQIAYEQAVLSLQLAELQKQQLLEPVDEADIRIAEANVNSAWGAYLGLQNAVAPEDIEAAQIQYERVQAAYQAAVDARTNADAGQTEQAYQLLDAQVGAASFNMEIARLQLEGLQNGNQGALNVAYARVLQAQRELERVQAGPTQAEIDRADLAIQQAQVTVDEAQKALDQLTLTAPFDGVVTTVNAEVGVFSAPGIPVIELTDLSSLYVEAQVDEIDVRQVREGMPAQVVFDALPGVELQAVLDQIALVGTNDTGIVSYDVEVTLNERDPRARVGMTAEASVIVEQRQDVILVPNQYIRLDRNTGQAFVNVTRADGSIEEIEVTLGLQGQDSSEVVDGLRVGDVIAIDLSSDSISFLGG
jgi:HlyD family secretion protein